jgi:hypothetical protein
MADRRDEYGMEFVEINPLHHGNLKGFADLPIVKQQEPGKARLPGFAHRNPVRLFRVSRVKG